MSICVDIGDFKKLSAKLAKFPETEDLFIRELINDIAQREFRLLVKKTPKGVYPKGRKGGFLRGNWVMGRVRHTGNAYTITFSNSTYYAWWVENGHRIKRHGVTIGWVKGRFMMKISEEIVNDAIREIVNNKATEYFGGLFND